MLAIFDIDGTIFDTQEVEGRCYSQAFEEIFNLSIETIDWTRFEEPTSSGIVRSLCKHLPDLEHRERQFKDRFVQLLKEERPMFPGDFSPIDGALDFILTLSADPQIMVAFATGGFDTEAEFKLRCCGINIQRYPHATSSDTPKRRDIIPLAASRAGRNIHQAVYFGDAPWDVDACKALGIPMVGIGRRIEQLRELGLSATFRDYSEPDLIRTAMQDKSSFPIHGS